MQLLVQNIWCMKLVQEKSFSRKRVRRASFCYKFFDRLSEWRRSVVVSVLATINVVTRRWARLLLGWVIESWQVNRLGM